MAPIAWVAGLLLVAAALAGCTSTPTTQPGGEPLLGDPAALSPAPPLAAQRLFPLVAKEGQFAITEGPNAGTLAPYAVAAKDGKWYFKIDGVEAAYLTPGPDGALILAREEDFGEKVFIEYDPPLHFPGAKEAQAPATESVTHLRIRRLADGVQREDGQCRYRVDLLGQQTVKTPAGVFEAYIVKMTRRLDLRWASVDVTILTAYVPDRGQVAERIEQVLHPLGVGSITTVREIRLAR